MLSMRIYLCEWKRQQNSLNTQFYSLYRWLTHSFAHSHQMFQHCASVCTRITNWNKYVAFTHACGNSGLLASSKTVVFGCQNIAISMKSRCVNGAACRWTSKSFSVDHCEIEQWGKRFTEGNFWWDRDSVTESIARARTRWVLWKFVWFTLRLKSTHRMSECMSGGRKREDHICIVSFRSLNALYRNGNFVAMFTTPAAKWIKHISRLAFTQFRSVQTQCIISVAATHHAKKNRPIHSGIFTLFYLPYSLSVVVVVFLFAQSIDVWIKWTKTTWMP